MLHLYLLSLDIDPYLILKSTSVLYPWINEAFKNYHEDTANLLNHTKMFPLFIEMDYPAENFITNYKVREVSKRNLKDLKAAYPFLKGDERKTIAYVTLFFLNMNLMKGCVNSDIKYYDDNEMLKKLDNELYTIIDVFWKSWDKLDINSPIAFLDINSMVGDLYFGLNNYVANKLK